MQHFYFILISIIIIKARTEGVTVKYLMMMKLKLRVVCNPFEAVELFIK